MRTRRVCRIVAMIALVALVEGTAVWPTSAQTAGWVIIPGKSWGPIVLGETEDGVLSALGAPTKRDDSTNASYWKYPKAGLRFIRRVPQNPSDTFMLWSIDVWDPAASTREGIRMGARLPNVLRTYGDTGDNLHVATNCLDITIQGDHSGTQTSYESPTLSLTYFDRGVKFDLDWTGTPGAFLVRSMTVRSPAECQ